MADPSAAQFVCVCIDPGARHAEHGRDGRSIHELDRARLRQQQGNAFGNCVRERLFPSAHLPDSRARSR